MKKTRVFILISCILLAVLTLASCKGGDSEDTAQLAKSWIVTFDTQGGSKVDSVRVLDGNTISAPTDPKKDGYIFDGWSYNAKDWDFTSDKVTADITLIAKWINADTVYGTEAVDGGVMITGVKRKLTSMTVPSIIGGRTVVAIGEGVFMDTSSEDVSVITVAETVTSVGKNAFKNCVDIEIRLDGSLVSVGEGAFLGCNKLTSVSFGEGLSEIPFEAFCGCSALTELRLPASLVTIGENAFEDCTSIKTVMMHNGITSVQNGAFHNTASLAAVYFYGTEDDVDNISLDDMNDNLADVMTDNIYFYSKENPASSGKYWYLSDNGKVKIWED